MTEIPELPELEFSDERHEYRVNGIKIPAVSAILEPLSSANYGTVSRSVLNRAAEKGTAVHNAIENWIKFGIEDIDPAWQGYFDAFLQWWAENVPEPLGSEVRIYHRLLMYAGTCDLIAVIDGKTVLVDYKTSAQVSAMVYGVQLEAYAQALEQLGVRIDRKLILHLKKDGTFAEHEFPAKDVERWRVFGCLKQVYDYIHSQTGAKK